MALVKGKAQQTSAKQGESEGADVFLRALRDGSMVLADWKQAAVMGGFGFMTHTGAFSTGVAGGGSAAVIDADRPNFTLSIPDGISVVPLRIGVHVITGAPADANELEILIAVDVNQAMATAGTATADTIYNMNTLASRASTCIARDTYSATLGADPSLELELARKVLIYDLVSTGTIGVIMDLVYEPQNPPIINGPAALYVHFGGAAASTGYVDATWLEFTESTFSV